MYYICVQVLVLEQHEQAGGSCHTFMDKGYTNLMSVRLVNPIY
jgi:phytoene dehydrogenase-like protein